MLLSAQSLLQMSQTPCQESAHTSALISHDDDGVKAMDKEDSGVFLSMSSSVDSELSQLAWAVEEQRKGGAGGKEEVRPGVVWGGPARGRRHSCTPITPMPVIHDDEIMKEIKSTRIRKYSLGDIIESPERHGPDLGDGIVPESQSRRCSAHSITSTGSLPQGVEKLNLGSGVRRCSVHSAASCSSAQSQLPTIIDSEVLPPQPVGQWTPVVLHPPHGHFRRRSAALVAPPGQMSVITSGDIYCSLPCRSHHKPLNVHSKLMCQQQRKINCQCRDEGEQGKLDVISPIMQLYMESSNPVLQDYVKQIMRLNSNEGDSCRECSQRNSIASLPLMPAQPVPATHILIPGSVEGEEGEEVSRPLKPEVEKECTAMRRRAARDVVCSVLRNLTCYMLLVALVLIILHGGVSFYDGPQWRSITPLVLLVIGVIGLTLQVKHVLQECRHPRHRTLIAQMLASRTKHHSMFIRMIHDQLSCAPFVAIEIHKKHRIQVRASHNTKLNDVEAGVEGKDWSRVSKTISKMLSYTSWSDRSEDISLRDWDHARCNWIIVAKDYRAANADTENSLHQDIVDFSRASFFDEAHPHGMTSRLVLDVMEGEAHPDVQVYLVCPDHGKSRFYTFHTYKAMLYMGLDSLYAIAFHVATRHIGQYNITKVIDRRCAQLQPQESAS